MTLPTPRDAIERGAKDSRADVYGELVVAQKNTSFDVCRRRCPNGTYFITPPSLREGREESSGEGRSNRYSVSGLNNEVRPPRPLPRPTLPEEECVVESECHWALAPGP